MVFFFFFKQKTAYEMRISDWSSDVCSSDLRGAARDRAAGADAARPAGRCARRLGRAASGRAARFAARGGDRRGHADRKRVVSGKSVSGRGDLGGSRIIKKKKLQ